MKVIPQVAIGRSLGAQSVSTLFQAMPLREKDDPACRLTYVHADFRLSEVCDTAVRKTKRQGLRCCRYPPTLH